VVPIKFGVLGLGPLLIVMGVMERHLILIIWGVFTIGAGAAIWYYNSHRD
jgi:hypothetical protein